MRCHRISIILLFLILISSIFVQADIPSHKNFQEADEDLYAILSFLSDTKFLCEKVLINSYYANCTIIFNETIQVSCSQEFKNKSIINAQKLQEGINYFKTILKVIKNQTGNYDNLKEILMLIKEVGNNVISLAKFHHEILLNFKTLIDIINSKKLSDIITFNLLYQTQNTINNCRYNLSFIEESLNDIGQFFPINSITIIVNDFYQLLNKYNHYLSKLIDFFPAIEPILFIQIDKENVYLGDNIHVSGYFIGEDGFIANQRINLILDEVVINQTDTNNYGHFDFLINVPLGYNLYTYNLSTFTIYNHTILNSNKIYVSIHKIPTKIILSTQKYEYQPNEKILLSGQLTTYQDKGISDYIILHLPFKNITISTNNTGNFEYTYSGDINYGEYLIFATFINHNIYDSCHSNNVKILVNTPTSVSIYSDVKNVDNSNPVKIYGFLYNDLSNSPISQKQVKIYLNNEVIGSSVSNQTGFYNFSVTSSDLQIGINIFFTKFNSDDLKWRSSKSDILQIKLIYGDLTQKEIRPSFIITVEKNFYLIIMIIIIFIIIITFSFKRSIHFHKIDKNDKIHQNPLFSTPFHSPYNKKKYNLNKTKSKFITSTDTSLTIKQKIIKQYKLLLRFLSSKGFHFSSSNTHLDIQKNLIEKGSSKKIVDNITSKFEKARYSQNPIKKTEFNGFDKNILDLITDFEDI